MSWWHFPPRTKEVQLDEKWAFVHKKKDRCDQANPADKKRGDNWDHVAFDPEHKLALSLVCGKRTRKNVHTLVADVHRRTEGRMMRLITSDEYTPYREAILRYYGESYRRRRRGKRGQRPRLPGRRADKALLYATVHKHRRKGRVVKVSTRIIYGTRKALEAALKRSCCSSKVNTSFIERYNATDRHRNARKVRKSYRFSKDWEIHNAASALSVYSYNFCWPVSTLRQLNAGSGLGAPRTPAMAAGLTDHVWSIEEWSTYPAITSERI
jgi:IS1 family transposase